MKNKSLLVLFVPLPFAVVAFACGGSDGDSPQASAPADDGATPQATPDAVSAESGTDAAAHCADYRALKNPYFGDLHSHTSYSADAYAFDTRNTPLDAFAFARGKTLQVAGAGPDGGGPMTKLERPLDFLAVTDHSEFLAVAYGCGVDLQGNPVDPTKAIFDTLACKAFRSDKQAVELAAIFAVLKNVCDGGKCVPVVSTAWAKEQQAAAAAYQRCAFTSFMAYEWTKTNGGVTLHKNVIFGSDKVPNLPFDALAYPTQEALWKALASGCGSPTGCDALTIPHNSNLSQGLAFEIPTAAADQDNMVRYQKLVEIFQHKGGSECLSPDDKDCTFEQIPNNADPVRDKPGYVREGLKKGLALQATGGKNLLTLGIVGATDDHNGTPGNTSEGTWPGHVGSNDDTAAKRLSSTEFQNFNPGGLTVAWAEENTRESLYAAFQRRETYATSGTRIVVRFYETSDAGDLCADPDFPKALVAAGAIPMGGSFESGATPPRFVVRAWKDQTSLSRVDVIKAWIDESGAAQEKVISKDLDASQLASACVTYTDDEKTPGPALYYARVLEAETPRWSAYDCTKAAAANPQGCASGGAMRAMIKERAWTSPIWRNP